MKKQDIARELSWFKAENYDCLKTLTLTEIYFELKIRATFNMSKLMHLSEENMLEQMGKPDNELPKIKDSDTDFNFWMQQIVNGNPVLSKQIVAVDELTEIKNIEDAYRLNTYYSLPAAHLITFDNLEHLYLRAKEKLNTSTDKNFSQQLSSVYDLFESHEIYEFRHILFQASIGHTSDESLKLSFESMIPEARSKLGMKGPFPPTIQKKENTFSPYPINLSFFKVIYVQRLIQLSDCINWFALNDLPLHKALIIDTIYNDVELSTANMYQTYFKNVSLITDHSVNEGLRNILIKSPKNQSKPLSVLMEELKVADIQKNK